MSAEWAASQGALNYLHQNSTKKQLPVGEQWVFPHRNDAYILVGISKRNTKFLNSTSSVEWVRNHPKLGGSNSRFRITSVHIPM